MFIWGHFWFIFDSFLIHFWFIFDSFFIHFNMFLHYLTWTHKKLKICQFICFRMLFFICFNLFQIKDSIDYIWPWIKSQKSLFAQAYHEGWILDKKIKSERERMRERTNCRSTFDGMADGERCSCLQCRLNFFVPYKCYIQTWFFSKRFS